MSRGSLKGSVSKRNGKWRARYWDDRGRQHSRTFALKGQADAWLRQELEALHSGATHTPEGTLAAYAEVWFERLARDIRPSTLAGYRGLYSQHVEPTLGGVELSSLTPPDVRAWYAALRATPKHGRTDATPLSRSTCAKVYRLLKRLCGEAVEDGYLATNPCRIKGASTEPDYTLSYAEPPTANEVRALAAAVPERYRAMVLVAGFGGLRWGEVAGLQRRHVDLASGTIRVDQQLVQVDGGTPGIGPPKTAAGTRTVYLHDEVTGALRHHLDAFVADSATGAFIFTTPRGALLRASNFRRKVWIPATEVVGRPGRRFHDLRHTAATLAAMTGASTKDLMARMGHRSQAAAVRYQHATQTEQALIAERLGAMLAEDTPAGTNVVPLRRVQ